MIIANLYHHFKKVNPSTNQLKLNRPLNQWFFYYAMLIFLSLFRIFFFCFDGQLKKYLSNDMSTRKITLVRTNKIGIKSN